MWDMTHLYVWRDSFVRATWLIHIYSYMWHDSFIRVTWLIYTCGVTYQCRFICVTWLALELIVVAFYIWSIYLLQYWCSVIYMCGMTYLYVWHDPCIPATWLIHIHSCVTWLALDHIPLIYAWYTGWRRLIWPLKLQIIFQYRATKYRSLLWKMICEDKGPYASSPPCTLCMHIFVCQFMCAMTHSFAWC